MKRGMLSVKFIVLLLIALVLLAVGYSIIKGGGVKQEGVLDFIFGKLFGR